MFLDSDLHKLVWTKQSDHISQIYSQASALMSLTTKKCLQITRNDRPHERTIEAKRATQEYCLIPSSECYTLGYHLKTEKVQSPCIHTHVWHDRLR